MDDHRKKAEEIANKFSHLFAITGGGTYSSWYRLIDEMENALRSTASKSEKDGWNKAINEAAHYACDAVHHVSCKPLSMEKKGHYIAKHIRRLIREEGK
jgi:hypothetical protein